MLGLARAAVKQPLRLTVLTKTCRSTATRYMHTARHIAAPTCSARFTVALRAFHHTSQWTPARSISTTHSLKKSKKNVTSGTPPSPKLSQVDPQPEPASSGPSPKLAPPAVGRWLLMSSGLVFAIVVVGGLTRLTESGLSITEWKPITGTLPPLSQAAWEEEFDKYRATPEFKMLNSAIDLEDFKRIFFWEWGHRVLGRVIGVAFLLPFGYFASRGILSGGMSARLAGMTALIGAQGALGWYMVRSGLDDALLTTPGAVPRVSQYRLAAHLGTALALYAGMFWNGMAVLQDWRHAQGTTNYPARVLKLANFHRAAKGLTALVLLTAVSGAFVAGLDAGLLYNEFPLMGGQLAPPVDELFSKAYAKASDASDLWWRNIFENPVTVQFDHRVLATTTYLGIAALWATAMLRPNLKAALQPATRRMLHSAFGMANVQVALGISTLLYLVPVPLAACHQAGSVMLLTTMLHLLLTMRSPGQAAMAWRQAKAAAASTVKAGSIPLATQVRAAQMSTLSAARAGKTPKKMVKAVTK